MVTSAVDGDVTLVRFELPSVVAATTVSVCGDFNGWSPDAQPLERQEDGSFRADVPLAAGRRWRFRYLVDGHRWENDWAADDYVLNEFGSHDSVVDLTGAPPVPLTPATPVRSVAPVRAASTGATLAGDGPAGVTPVRTASAAPRRRRRVR